MNFFAILILISSIFSFSGHITQNTTWDEDVIVTGNVWIDPGVTLTIMPGVNVKFVKVDVNDDNIGDTQFIIQGRLLSQGMANNKVYFTSNEDNPQPNDWSGFYYETNEDGELSIVSNTEILYADKGFHLNGRNVTFNACRIAESGSYGMRIQSTIYTTTFNTTLIESNQDYGLLIENGTVNISGLSIFNNGSYGMKALSNVSIDADDLILSTNNGVGLILENLTDASFTDSRSVSNTGHGIDIDNGTPQFSNCDFSNNGNNGIDISDANPTFTNCTIQSNDHNGIELSNGSNPNFQYCDINFNEGTGFFVYESSEPIINYSNIFENEQDSNFQEIRIDGLSVIADVGGSSCTHKSDSQNINFGLPSKQIGYVKYHVQAADRCDNNPSLSYSIRVGETTVSERDDWGNGTGFTQVISDNISISDLENVTTSEINVRVSHGQRYNTHRTTLNEVRWTTVDNNSQIVTYNEYSDNNSIDAQFNWWGQITEVDSLVYQTHPSTVVYQNNLTSFVEDAGADLPNLAPSITVNSPSMMNINPENIVIEWNDLDMDNDANISLFYDDGLDQTGSLIVSGISEDDESDSFDWNLTDVPFGTYYIYAVIDDGENEPFVSYSQGQVMVGPLTVQVPLNASGVAGTESLVPIEVINSIDYFGIVSFQFTLSYNPSIITAIGVEQNGTLSDDWVVFTNASTDGQISINGFSTEPLNSSGTLLNVVFDVNENANNYDSSPLSFADFTFNEGEPEAVSNDGTFTVINKYNIEGNTVYYFDENNFISGIALDLDNGEDLIQSVVSDENGFFEFDPVESGQYNVTPSFDEDIHELVITPYDASLTAQFALFLYAFTTDQQSAADVSGDGTVSAFDAALIAQYSVGMIDEFNGGKWQFNPTSKQYTLDDNFYEQNFLAIAIGDPSGNWTSDLLNRQNLYENFYVSLNKGDNLNIDISANESFQSCYLDMNLPEGLELISIENSPKLNEFSSYNKTDLNNFKLASYGIDMVEVSEESVYTLSFSANSTIDDNIDIMALFDEKNISSISLETESQLPSTFEISNVYPNPFNPTTSIEYAVPNDAYVSFVVYNSNGQKINELVNENKLAGNYKTQFNGDNISSGIYFIKMYVDNLIVDSKKITLVK